MPVAASISIQYMINSMYITSAKGLGIGCDSTGGGNKVDWCWNTGPDGLAMGQTRLVIDMLNINSNLNSNYSGSYRLVASVLNIYMHSAIKYPLPATWQVLVVGSPRHSLGLHASTEYK